MVGPSVGRSGDCPRARSEVGPVAELCGDARENREEIGGGDFVPRFVEYPVECGPVGLFTHGLGGREASGVGAIGIKRRPGERPRVEL